MAVVVNDGVVVTDDGVAVCDYGAPDYITAPSFSSPIEGVEITPTAATWYDGSHDSYLWQVADDAAGTNAATVGTAANYTPQPSDDGKYLQFSEINIRDGQTTSASTGWIGPVGEPPSTGRARCGSLCISLPVLGF